MKLFDVLTSPWAIVPTKLDEITAIYDRHLRGEKIDIAAIEARVGKPMQNEPARYVVQNGVALVPVDGVLAKKANMFMQISGAMSMQMIGAEFQKALNDPAVTAVVLVVDSPGGTVDGTQDLARAVYDARGGAKPVVAWVDGMMASAAYWVGSAADAIFVGANTDAIGSIGVAMQHVERSAADAQEGIKRTDIYAGKYKRIASDAAPLSKEGKAYLQDQVDGLYKVFVDAVAQQRGVSVDAVLSNMADGRIFLGQQAIDAGLVDGASTLQALVAQLSSGTYQRKRAGMAGAVAPALFAPSAESSDAGAASNLQPETEGISTMNKEQLAKDHPELFKAIRDEGFTAGAAAELARIQAVHARSMRGHEALITTLMFDGKTTGPEAADQILTAERATLDRQRKSIAADVPAALPAAPSSTGEVPSTEASDDGLSVEERCKKDWDANAQIRGEFATLASYTAWARADATGRIKTQGAKK